MPKNVVFTTMLGVAALAMTSGHGRNITQHSRAATRRPMADDDRRPQPGTHRAKAAELAVRNRVAAEESLKIQRAAALRRQQGQGAALTSVPATSWVSLGPTDAFKEFNGVDIAGV